MDYQLDNFTYCETRAVNCTLSCKAADVAACSDSIALAPCKLDSGVVFTLDFQLAADIWSLATEALASVVICVTNALFLRAKQFVRRAAAIGRRLHHNQRGGCREAYKMLMALRL